jgi:hypothetical protein
LITVKVKAEDVIDALLEEEVIAYDDNKVCCSLAHSGGTRHDMY